MRTIGVVSVGRSDYSILRPLLSAIKKEKGLKLCLMVTGSHLSKEYGLTYRDVESDGFIIGEKVKMRMKIDTPETCATDIGIGVVGFAKVYAKRKLDMVVVLGDRFEMLAAAVATIPYNIPVVHISGGDVTEGAIDDVMRHMITKCAHLHFPSTKEYARRIKQMGEEPWRVKNFGALNVDSIKQTKVIDKKTFYKNMKLASNLPLFLVTYHPVTRELCDTKKQIKNLIAALKKYNANMLVTYPNIDPSNRAIIEALSEFRQKHEHVHLVKNLGVVRYYSAMKYADCMIGNSSSGILESGTYKLPTVNIGNRQKNRASDPNVIHVGCAAQDICVAINRAISPAFNRKISKMKSIYGSGQAAKRIVPLLKNIALDKKLVIKAFRTREK